MFEKLVSFTKDVSDLADQPALGSAAALKAQFDAAPDEVRQYLNKLIDALKSTTAGDSGAKNIGATGISGLTGNDVQALLESLKSYTDSTFAKGATKIKKGWVEANETMIVHVDFDAPFAYIPTILVTPTSNAGYFTSFYVYSATTTGFDIYYNGEMNHYANQGFNWMAIGD